MNCKLINCDKDKLYLLAKSTDERLLKGNFFKILLGLISVFFFRRVEFEWREKYENSKILFALTQTEYRKDILDFIFNISRTINPDSRDIIGWKKKRSISVKRVLRNIGYLYSQLRSNIGSKSLIYELFRYSMDINLLDYQDDINKYLSINKYKLCVVTYDAIITDNYVSQFFRLQGVKTATLQHGIMLAPRLGLEDNIDFKGIEFNGFVSDYFLAWNDFTRNEAIKSGIPQDKIVVCGCAKLVGKRKAVPSFNKVIGVILDGRFEKENNIPMISIVSKFAEQKGYHYILRFHPNFLGNEYDDIINNQVGSICDKEIPLCEFLNSVEFCVLANSTVLFELEGMNFPFYRYSSRTIKDKYKDYPIKSFSSLLELNKLCDFNKDNGSSLNNVSKFNYQSFFLQYL
jgi:hypothetical protein